MLEGQRALFRDQHRGRTFGGELTLQDWFVPVLFQERPDPVLFQRTGDARLRAVAARARQIALGELPPSPDHSFVGRSRELLLAERLLCGQRLAPDDAGSAAASDARYAVFLGEGGEGKTTLAVELARWLVETHRFDQAAFVSVEQEASLHSVIARLGRQLVTDYVGRSANNDDVGRRLISETLLERGTLLVIDNLESIVAAPHESTGMAGSGVAASGVAASGVAGDECSEPPVDGSAESTPDQAPRRSGTTSDTATSATLSATTDDVLTPLFDLLAELNALGKTRILFTTRTPLPVPFNSNHIRIGRLSESAAVELVGNLL